MNLGTMERTRVIDAVREVLRYAGHNAEVKPMPDMPTGPFSRVADNSLARRLLGWEPKVKFMNGLHRTIDWYFSTKERGEAAGITVPCSMDELAQSLPSPDLIKIDVEGAEVNVLRGGSVFLQRARPRVIVEFSGPALLAEARSLLPFYRFSPLSPTHWVLHA